MRALAPQLTLKHLRLNSQQTVQALRLLALQLENRSRTLTRHALLRPCRQLSTKAATLANQLSMVEQQCQLFCRPLLRCLISDWSLLLKNWPFQTQLWQSLSNLPRCYHNKARSLYRYLLGTQFQSSSSQPSTPPNQCLDSLQTPSLSLTLGRVLKCFAPTLTPQVAHCSFNTLARDR